VGGFAAAQDLGMRFEETDQLRRGWESLLVKEAPHGLLDDLFHQGQQL
jgi:hypothetical protein